MVVVTVGEDLPRTTKVAVESARQTTKEALETPGERLSSGCLTEHVHVIRLHRELDDAKTGAVGAGADCPANDAKTIASSKRR